MLKPRFSIASLCLMALISCNRSGEIKVKNNIPKTTIENVYWGEVYIGGSLKPGQETEYIEIERSEAKLPAEYRIYFSIEADEPIKYYTAERYPLNKKGQLFVDLTDSTEVYEVED